MPDKETCEFRLEFRSDFHCPHEVHDRRLCIFHLLSLGEKYPDHEQWKLTASIPRFGAKIQQDFSALLRHIENDPSCSVADFSGFRLPSINLRKHIFTKPVVFAEVRFYGEVTFSEATFEQAVDFSHAVFAKSADFYSMVFEDSASFGLVRFEGNVGFVDGGCKGRAEFDAVEVTGRVKFLNWDFDGGCSLWDVRHSNNGSMQFELVDLSKASFLSTQLEWIEFRAVAWHKQGKRRNMLWDEASGLLPGNDSEHRKTEAEINYFHEQLAENYRQLVLNYERMRDFDTAEDFHFGEMEMRNLIAERRYGDAPRRWLWRHLGPYKLYRLFSGYGASLGKAFAWLLVWLFLIFPSAFMLAGFKRVESSENTSTSVIQYALKPDLENFRQWISDYSEAASFSLSVATFQRVRRYEPLGPWSYFLMSAGSIAFTSQTALLLLALRRRFKR